MKLQPPYTLRGGTSDLLTPGPGAVRRHIFPSCLRLPSQGQETEAGAQGGGWRVLGLAPYMYTFPQEKVRST